MSQTIFHKTEPPWFDRVRHLKPGGRCRIGDGKLVSFNGKGWHLFDFREKESEVYEPLMTLAERLALLEEARNAATEAVNAGCALPDGDAMHHPKDWPSDARVWFYRAGINNDNLRDLGAFWSPSMRRLVLPYVTVDGSEAWIARDVSWSKGTPWPKYLFPVGAKRGGGALFVADPSAPYPTAVCITEDALSAYRISRDTGVGAIAAQGTSLDRDTVVAIANVAIEARQFVFLWLDPDKYGQMGAAKLRQQFGNLGVVTRNIVSARDPKLHEPEELREALGCS